MATIKKAKVAPAPLVTKTAKTAKTVAPAAATAPTKVSKFKGLHTGLRVMEYQDRTFAANIKAMLTDEELAADWRKEFPNAVAFTPFHVKGARRDFNAGRHSKAYAALKPATPLAEVILDGNRRVFATVAREKEVTPAPVVAETGKKRGAKRDKAA